MSAYPPSPARQLTHAAMYKMPSPTIRSDETWKDRYRQHCKQQFKRARDKLISKMRHLSFDDENQPTLSAQEIVESEWIKMFGALPSTTGSGDMMDTNSLTLSSDDAEFEANWTIMNEIRRELELEQLGQTIPDEQPEYIPSIDDIDQTRCPLCSNLSLHQRLANDPIACQLCPFRYYLKAGSLSDVHQYHRQNMAHCHENALHTTLWYHDESSVPSLLFLCTNCDLNYCLQ